MSVARRLAVMRNAEFLKPLADDALKFLAFNAEPMALRQRQTLFEAGDDAEGAVLVLAGQLRLIPDNPQLAPATAGVGQLIDDLALIVPRQRQATAIAQSTCELLLISRSEMLKVLGEYPEAATTLATTIAARVRAIGEEAGAVSAKLSRSARNSV
ncbi:MAG: cyclic nucleotide-binding domain-containing protein [Pseudomonadota bacterium]